MVVNDEQRETLATLKKRGNRRRTRDEVKEVVERATEYFNPDLFDLTEFYSDRVIEIGIYKPKFYPFVSPYKSEWITGATVEMPGSGTTELLIKNADDLEDSRQLRFWSTERYALDDFPTPSCVGTSLSADRNGRV